MWVNITNLKAMIAELEAHYDPMTQWVGRYGCSHEMIDYPHGSTGHFFSNYAMRQFVKHISYYDSCRPDLWDDLCVRIVMDQLGQDFYAGCSTQFIISFPRTGGLQNISAIAPCENWNFFERHSQLQIPPTPMRDAVTVHMHSIPMEAWTMLLTLCHNLSVVWAMRSRFTRAYFCHPRKIYPRLPAMPS
jgi:hypothetical protein